MSSRRTGAFFPSDGRMAAVGLDISCFSLRLCASASKAVTVPAVC